MHPLSVYKEDSREELPFRDIMNSSVSKNTFLEYPCLPENRVTDIFLCKDTPPQLKSALEEIGITIHPLDRDERLDDRISYHTDVLCCNLGKNNVVFSKPQPQIDIDDINITISDAAFGKNYPYDVPLNAAVIKNLIICNIKYTDPHILSYAHKNNWKIIDVKQGYAKCSILPITQSAVITDDIGIYSALSDIGFDVLFIDKCVRCEGYDCGFIGGAAARLSEDSIFFTGIFEDNETKRRIESFINKHSLKTIYLTDLPIFDVGSIIPVRQAAF